MIDQNEFIEIGKQLGKAIETSKAAHARIDKQEQRVETALREINVHLVGIGKQLQEIKKKESFTRGVYLTTVAFTAIISTIVGWALSLLK